MPTAMLLNLKCQEDNAIYGFTGQHVYYACRSIWQDALEEALFSSREEHEITPWTVSPLLGVEEMRHRRTPLLAGDVAQIRLTVLDDRLLPLLEDALCAKLESIVRIGDVPWQLTEVVNAHSEDPRTGYESFHSLSDKYISNYSEPPTKWKLALETPTAVETADGNYLPFPLPTRLLQYWLKSWAVFAPSHSLFDVDEVERLSHEIGSKLSVFRYSLKAVGTSFALGSGRLPEAGCIGRIALHAQGHSQTELQIVAAMLDYSFYSGTGIYTELGLGQTKLG